MIKTIPLIGDEEVRELSWNHDGSLLASASSKLQIWDRNGELKHAAKADNLLEELLPIQSTIKIRPSAWRIKEVANPKGQRPEIYQPGLPGPGRMGPQDQGLKARHILLDLLTISEWQDCLFRSFLVESVFA